MHPAPARAHRPIARWSWVVAVIAVAQVVACTGAGGSRAEAPPGAGPAPPPAGRWKSTLPTQNGPAVLTVDIGRVGTRWVGEFDLEGFRVENYPVEVEVKGRNVTLHLSAIGVDFRGVLSDDGRRMIETSGDADAIVLERTGEAQFSEHFLELESAAGDSTAVTLLAMDARELRTAFNRDTARVRLLLLLSPT